MAVDAPAVVVLKTQPNPLHAGAMGIARSLGAAGVRVHVLGDVPGGPLAWSRYVHAVQPMPPGDVGAEEVAEAILEAAPAGRALLVPVDDVGALLVSDRAEQLQARYRFPSLPPGLAATVCDKVGLARLAVEARVPTPACYTPDTEEELAEVVAGVAFPVVVKARDPRLLRVTPEARSVALAENPASLRQLWRGHLVEGRPNCMLQEYIPGGPETVWMVNAYVDGESRMHLAASGRKLRQRPAYTGPTTLGICQRNDEVLALTAQLVRSIGYHGVLDIGWRYDARDRCYKVLDLNPRVGATFRLFAASNGADVVRALYADLTGRPLPTGEVRDGRRWMDDYNDLRVARQYITDGTATSFSYLRSVVGVDERVWCRLDDPVPAMAAIREALIGRRRRRPDGNGEPAKQPGTPLEEAATGEP
jgi:predicted ATP-grasp superfamily ATP-dependent carboligase